ELAEQASPHTPAGRSRHRRLPERRYIVRTETRYNAYLGGRQGSAELLVRGRRGASPRRPRARYGVGVMSGVVLLRSRVAAREPPGRPLVAGRSAAPTDSFRSFPSVTPGAATS